MNERIKALAQESFFDEATNAPSDKMYTFSEAKMEHFAELIIQECMRMCDCADVSFLEHNCQKEASGAAYAKEMIKEHFGVEE
jgi:hypothetical protein